MNRSLEERIKKLDEFAEKLKEAINKHDKMYPSDDKVASFLGLNK